MKISVKKEEKVIWDGGKSLRNCERLVIIIIILRVKIELEPMSHILSMALWYREKNTSIIVFETPIDFSSIVCDSLLADRISIFTDLLSGMVVEVDDVQDYFDFQIWLFEFRQQHQKRSRLEASELEWTTLNR